MKQEARELLALSFANLLFAITYLTIYPLHAPLNGYFMIEKIPRYFWALYVISLMSLLIFLLNKSLNSAKPLRIVLTYVLLYLCSLRTFASLHFTGFMGSDSPNFVGLTQYWASHNSVDLSKVSYGDNPGFFILGKVIISITGLDINLYTILIGVTWITIVYLVFRLITFKYTATFKTIQLSNHNQEQSLNTIVPLIATLSYFTLAVPFVVNFQYAPQTFALVMLLIFFLIMTRFLENPLNFKIFILVLTTYAAIQVSHPFMFMFSISTIVSLLLIKWFSKLKSSNAVFPYIKSRGFETLLSTMVILSFVYVLYQTVALQRRVGEVIKNILEVFELRFLAEHFERLSTPAFPYYEFGYYLVAVVHSITWIIATIIIAIFVLITIVLKIPKYYEISIVVGSVVALIPFMSTFMLQEFAVRGGQVLLFGILLLAIKGLLNVNHLKRIEFILKYTTRFLLILLIVSSFLAMARYTWYTQPPHLSSHDMLVINILDDKIDVNSNFNIFSKNAFSVYYCSRNYGRPFTYCTSPILLASKQHLSIEKYDLVLWERSLTLELLKYAGNWLQLYTLIRQRDVLINANGIYLFKSSMRW
ncbi:MAG: hypothetical protein QXJ64_08470 [Thermosphaera sp.]